jgi:DNA-damage-inducible protein D
MWNKQLTEPLSFAKIYPEKGKFMLYDQIMLQLEACKKLTKRSDEYWMGRDIQTILGYDKWDNFKQVIEKAREACRNSKAEPKYHFLDVGKMITVGKGALREREDCYLTRYACYLVAMNGDSQKPEIGSAQTYFAIQTRRQELSDLTLNDEKRLELRDRVKQAVKHLNSAAKNSGVVNYAFFHDAGYRGLYGMGLRAIKLKKRISQKEDLLDRAGRAELAANEFRYTQTEERLNRDQIRDGEKAQKIHNEVGSEVRQAIKKIGGTLPENLPAEASIKILSKQKKVKQLPN